MTHYIDGFVFPIPSAQLDQYRRLAEAVARIWKEHGALEYREFVGDDLHREGTRPFPSTLEVTADEVVVFGWITFPSREVRDLANEKVAVDPRVEELMATAGVDFDGNRMAYGGFRPLVGAATEGPPTTV